MYIIRVTRAIRTIDIPNPIQTVILSGFQNPKSPQKENALTEPYGYWPDDTVSLDKTNLKKLVWLLNGRNHNINTISPVAP